MDYLQYPNVKVGDKNFKRRFKPYYKWITFNINIILMSYDKDELF